MTLSTSSETFQGWANYETWNVALYIQNEYDLYTMAKQMAEHGYKSLSHMLVELCGPVTPDGVYWKHADLDITELNEMLADLWYKLLDLVMSLNSLHNTLFVTFMSYQSNAISMLRQGQTGDEILEILDSICDTSEQQNSTAIAEDFSGNPVTDFWVYV